ncbi:YceI-like domain-containing protein [Fodinibius salinus]|uniref:YceI-like domain-containing protein n=1 Tax=Fodinibius salinus TaxID=860790 RepID=A0A5D3YJP4_9BACT|nr:YceI family protein [Fodinibius salinus]TYP93670.1 YceI-like domain-containing protein [Fodinibius salinus]
MHPALHKSVNVSNVVGLLSLITLLFISSLTNAQTIPGTIAIDDGAKIWIEGTAGPVNFRCEAQEISGSGIINNTINPKASVQDSGKVRISVSLPVTSLDCGKDAMNADMYNALKAEQHPQISYKLLEATLTDGEPSNGWLNIYTQGVMEIAGVRDTTEISIRGKVIGEQQFRVTGDKKIHMDTYDIEPPSKMFGLIRASKKLRVLFDVTVTLQDKGQ